MAEGFLGRWSERKRAVAAGQPVAEPEIKAAVVPAPPPARPGDPVQCAAPAAPPEPAPAPLTLADTQSLTPQSDFKPFVAPDVSPEVKNAAMKKLFADPHFNVMDGMDIYIDDYSKPDPLPESMLRQMASAKFLGLFDQVPDEQNVPSKPVSIEPIATENIAHEQAPTLPEQAHPPLPSPLDAHHAHPDLRLQPNHAAGPQEPGDRAQ
ncbi:MAG: DUF3306 domain-containing protein [Rhodoferax sp.]|nr:DUF3306 domain-containing protein [Rhodoferax sp.]